MEVVPLVVALVAVSYLCHYEERRMLLHLLPYLLILLSLVLFLWIEGSPKLDVWGPMSGLIAFMHLVSCWKQIFRR